MNRRYTNIVTSLQIIIYNFFLILFFVLFFSLCFFVTNKNFEITSKFWSNEIYFKIWNLYYKNWKEIGKHTRWIHSKCVQKLLIFELFCSLLDKNIQVFYLILIKFLFSKYLHGNQYFLTGATVAVNFCKEYFFGTFSYMLLKGIQYWKKAHAFHSS